jgi:hypothetical protein
MADAVSMLAGSRGEPLTKTIRIAKSLDIKLKGEAFRRSMAGNRRVVESDLIEAALLQYFNK